MIDYKRCSGWWGVWACVVDYPSHMVPESEFHKHGDDGLQGMCKACMSMRNVENHKVSNKETNAVSKEVYLLAGGSRAFYEKPKEERMGLRLVARKNHLPDTAPAQRVISFTESTKKETRKQPKFNQGKYKSPLVRAMEKGKIKPNPEFSREGPGMVYIYEDEMKEPGVLKIGSTQYSKGRLPSANTWGAFNCLYERHFERRYEAEDIVHTMLDDCRIWSDKEWFRVSLERAIKTIEGVELDDTKEQALG